MDQILPGGSPSLAKLALTSCTFLLALGGSRKRGKCLKLLKAVIRRGKFVIYGLSPGIIDRAWCANAPAVLVGVRPMIDIDVNDDGSRPGQLKKPGVAEGDGPILMLAHAGETVLDEQKDGVGLPECTADPSGRIIGIPLGVHVGVHVAGRLATAEFHPFTLSQCVEFRSDSHVKTSVSRIGETLVWMHAMSSIQAALVLLG
jgi:hypothetical protein